jgi:predicted transglutaminase-like cysteine proteinase
MQVKEVLKREYKQLERHWLYVTDYKQYGTLDLWSDRKPDENGIYTGDCEDFALTLVRKVIEAGIPPNQCGIALCWLSAEKKLYHCVAYVTEGPRFWIGDINLGVCDVYTATRRGYVFDRHKSAGRDRWKKTIIEPQYRSLPCA